MENPSQHSDHKGHESHDHPKHGHAGHEHHRMMIADFKRRFWISMALTVPILVLSPMIQGFFGFELVFPWSTYIIFVLASIMFFYGGWPFLKGMAGEVTNAAPGMMTLIAVAISVAYFYSVAVVFGLSGKMFFWELATLIVIMLLGHWIEMKSVIGASRALELLVGMMSSEAHRIQNDRIVDIKLEELQKEDIILIKPGEKVPADGIIIDGEGYLNESMLTDESKPVKKSIENKVIGGSINGNGSLIVKVEHTGKDSYLNKVITLVLEAQKAKSKTRHLADRAPNGLLMWH